VTTAVAEAPEREGRSDIDVLPSVQSWHLGELPNEGWLLFPENSTITVATSEAAVIEDRPQLTVTFTRP